MFKKSEEQLDEKVKQKGDIGTFFIGIVVFAVGLFMVLNNTTVSSYGIGYAYRGFLGGWTPPFGVLIIPFLIGIIIVIATDKDLLGTLFICVGLLIILVGILASINFTFERTSGYYMILMFSFVAVGIGLILKGMFGKSK